MKRRNFLITSAGLAGYALPTLGQVARRPCTPFSLNVAGGTAVNTACTSITGQQDWMSRSTGPGVVWAHRFDDPGTVSRFSVTGGTIVRHVANDGVLGDGCLSLEVPAGVGGSGSWGRPLRPIPGDINRAGLPLGPAITNNITNTFNNMKGGHFGHASYHAGSPGQFVGTDYYLQYRAKFHPNRFNANEPRGKMLMLVTNYVTPRQEIVTTARTDYGGGWYDMYTSVGSDFNSFLDASQRQQMGSALQPGGAFASTCVVGRAPHGGPNCFTWPTGEWVTVLIHVIPGREYVVRDVTSPSNPKDTGIEVWIARAGQTSYTKIWEKFDYVWSFGSIYSDGTEQPFGWNWLNFTPYTGGAAAVPSVNGWYHRHDQIIFSNQFIPCPLV